MTELIKGVTGELLKSSLVALILGIGLFYMYGDGKEERAQHVAALTARVTEAEKLARIVEQNSEALKQGQQTMIDVKIALTTEIREMRGTIERAFVWAKPAERERPASGGGS